MKSIKMKIFLKYIIVRVSIIRKNELFYKNNFYNQYFFHKKEEEEKIYVIWKTYK